MSIERETRAQRRVREREERRLSQRRGNRQLLTKGRTLVLAGLLVLGGAGYVATQGGKMLPALVSGEVQKSDEQIIQEEIQHLGIKRSQKEVGLWRTYGYGRSKQLLPISKETQGEATRRLKITLELMGESENPYFMEAVDFLFPLLASREAIFELVEKSSSIGAVALPALDGERLIWKVQVDMDIILNKRDSVGLAIMLVHEIEHLKDMSEFDTPYRSLSTQERYEKQEQWLRNTEKLRIGETRAYSRQAQAYLYQAGLFGFRDKGSEDEKLAIGFVSSGSSPTSPVWLEYITKNRLH